MQFSPLLTSIYFTTVQIICQYIVANLSFFYKKRELPQKHPVKYLFFLARSVLGRAAVIAAGLVGNIAFTAAFIIGG